MELFETMAEIFRPPQVKYLPYCRPTAFDLWLKFTSEYSRLSVEHSIELATIDQYIKNQMQVHGKQSRPYPFNYMAKLLNKKLGTNYPTSDWL